MAGALLICGSTLTVALLEQRRVATAEAAQRASPAAAPSGGGYARVNGRDPEDGLPEQAIALAAPTSAQWSHLRRPSTDGS
jgi:hypothetical protein